jgi:hypothetical protein
LAHLTDKSDLSKLRHATSFTLPSTAADPEPIVIKYKTGQLNYLQLMALREVAERPDPRDSKRSIWSKTMAIYQLPFIVLGDEDTSWNIEVLKDPYDMVGEWVPLEKSQDNANARLLPTDLLAFGQKIWDEVKAPLGIQEADTLEALSPLTGTPTTSSAPPGNGQLTSTSTEVSQSDSADATSSSSSSSSPTSSEASATRTADG